MLRMIEQSWVEHCADLLVIRKKSGNRTTVTVMLFHANGYAATSVRDIAKALDIQGASLYAHVASKEDVLFSIVDRADPSLCTRRPAHERWPF